MFYSSNLVHNPFMCNCHLAWFSEWLKNKGLSGSPPRCAGPDRVKDVPIRELPKTEFKCTSKFIIKSKFTFLILISILFESDEHIRLLWLRMKYRYTMSSNVEKKTWFNFLFILY